MYIKVLNTDAPIKQILSVFNFSSFLGTLKQSCIRIWYLNSTSYTWYLGSFDVKFDSIK